MFKKLCINLIAVVALFGSGNIFAQQGEHNYIGIGVGAAPNFVYSTLIGPAGYVAAGHMFNSGWGLEVRLSVLSAFKGLKMVGAFPLFSVLAAKDIALNDKLSFLVKFGTGMGLYPFLTHPGGWIVCGLAYHTTDRLSTSIQAELGGPITAGFILSI